jgi:hypothetical protein
MPSHVRNIAKVSPAAPHRIIHSNEAAHFFGKQDAFHLFVPISSGAGGEPCQLGTKNLIS